MSFFASVGYAQKSVDEEGFAERRRIAAAVTEIQQQQSIIVSSLTLWLRHRDYALSHAAMTAKERASCEATAQQALECLMEARKAENATFKELFGISEERLALPKRG